MTEQKNTHGGKRPGSGRPRKLNNPGTINFWIESEDIARLKEKYGGNLNKMFSEWVRGVLEEE